MVMHTLPAYVFAVCFAASGSRCGATRSSSCPSGSRCGATRSSSCAAALLKAAAKRPAPYTHTHVHCAPPLVLSWCCIGTRIAHPLIQSTAKAFEKDSKVQSLDQFASNAARSMSAETGITNQIAAYERTCVCVLVLLCFLLTHWLRLHGILCNVSALALLCVRCPLPCSFLSRTATEFPSGHTRCEHVGGTAHHIAGCIVATALLSAWRWQHRDVSSHTPDGIETSYTRFEDGTTPPLIGGVAQFPAALPP